MRVKHTDENGLGRPMSSYERKDAMKERERVLECPPCANPARRNSLEKNTAKWLLFYMPNAYPFPFSDGHLELIANVEKAARTGTGTATAQPRGEGKTSVLRGVCVKLVVTKQVRFPVLVGWKHDDAAAALGAWLTMLCDTPQFAEDYPELCTPFVYSTHATALKSLKWKHNGQKIGAMVNTMRKIITLPNSLGAIAARSAKGDAKGLSATLIDGSVVRPDFILLDDAQDVDQASNPASVAKIVDKLENVFLGMAGPQNRLTAAAACTVEAEGDVSCHWLNREGWTSSRVSRIAVWPDGSKGGTWDHKKDCKIKALWDDWRDIHLQDGQAKANTFFRKNRKAMVGKMAVSWEHRFDRKRDVCAYDAAMYDWYNLKPDVFARGQQNLPLKKGVDVYSLTPDVVMSRTVDRAPFEVPQWAEIVLCASDINPSYAISTAVYAYGKDATKACLWYGKFEDSPLPTSMDMSDQQKEQIIFGALWKHGEQLLRFPKHGKQWAIDGGGAQTTVAKRFSYEWNLKHPDMRVIVMYGRAGKTARVSAKNDTIRRRGVDGSWIHCRDKDTTYGWTEWVLWNADYWREIMQRSWTCETNAPGCSTLPKGSHREYAEHLCREKLRGKVELNGRMIYDFEKAPGRNDFSDATGMCHVLADMNGIGADGVRVAPKRTRVNVSMVKI